MLKLWNGKEISVFSMHIHRSAVFTGNCQYKRYFNVKFRICFKTRISRFLNTNGQMNVSLNLSLTKWCTVFFWNQLWLTYFCNRNQFFIGCTFSLHQAEVNFLYGYGKLYFFYVGFLMTIMILICKVFVHILKSMSSIYVLKIK